MKILDSLGNNNKIPDQQCEHAIACILAVIASYTFLLVEVRPTRQRRTRVKPSMVRARQ